MADGDVEMLWLVDQLRADLGADREVLDGRTREMLRTAAQGADLLSARRASELLSATGEPVPSRATDEALLQREEDAAALLLARAADGTAETAPVSGLTAIARDGAAKNDVAYFRLVRAHALAGDHVAARQVVEEFDKRRLRPDGAVLEHPRFEGTLGSTYRMVRYAVETGRVDEFTPTQRADILTQARAGLAGDVSHRLAGGSLVALLDPSGLTLAERSTLISDVMRIEGLVDGPLDLDGAVAWTYVAENAASMGVAPVTFPGLDESVVPEWTGVPPEVAAVSISRFLRSISTGGVDLPDDDVVELEAHLSLLLGEADPSDLDTEALFGSALALYESSGVWPVDPLRLREIANARDGLCMGGFSGFVRSAHEPDTPCSVDATLVVETSLRAIEQRFD